MWIHPTKNILMEDANMGKDRKDIDWVITLVPFILIIALCIM